MLLLFFLADLNEFFQLQRHVRCEKVRRHTSILTIPKKVKDPAQHQDDTTVFCSYSYITTSNTVYSNTSSHRYFETEDHHPNLRLFVGGLEHHRAISQLLDFTVYDPRAQ